MRHKINITDFKDKESPVYQCITPLRLLMKKNTHPKWFRRLIFLMDHKEEREQETSMWSEHQKNVVDFLLQTCNLNFTKEDVMWAIGLLKTNSILFGDEKARALFPMFSLINHSCSANAKHTIYIKNRRIAVQAQTDIKEGEEILINYTAFIIGTSFRRKKLLNNWYVLIKPSKYCEGSDIVPNGGLKKSLPKISFGRDTKKKEGGEINQISHIDIVI